jgi:SagB-type dehydrogenase family enzyme
VRAVVSPLSVDTVMVSLPDLVRLRAPESGTVELTTQALTLRLKGLDRGVQAALRRIADGPARLSDLEKEATSAYDEADLDRLALELDRLTGKLLLRFGCVVAGKELLRAAAVGPLARFSFVPQPDSARVRLSRFACIRRAGESLIIESPVSHACAEIFEPALGGLIARLASPCAIAELPRDVPGCGTVAIHAAAGFLLGVGVLALADESGATAEETDPTLVQREFHDVAMHAATRRGLTAWPVGGTFRFHGSLPPAPAIRPLPEGPRTALSRPRLDQIAAQDPPLATVMYSRQSVRQFGTDPISIDQLSEFLFRVATIKKVQQVDEGAGILYESSFRIAPSGGACHDLEFYLTVRHCAGLCPGIYHYDPAGHQLTCVCDSREEIRRMLLDAYVAAGQTSVPQVLISLVSRFTRLSWKYQGIAYATTLRNVGVLYEAMYLAATAMGLAPCALGGGNSAVFSMATGLNPFTESSVGEFMLGTRPDRAPTGPQPDEGSGAR